MPKKSQKDVVLDLIKALAPVRTEILKIEAMKYGISCPDRYARWLQEDGLIYSYKEDGDKTKSWGYRKVPIYKLKFKEEENGQLVMI